MFPILEPDRDGRRGTRASNKVSKWLRKNLKIEDSRIAPNHSWRRTFESVHRNELEPPTREDTANHITGHSQGGSSGRHCGADEIRRDRIEIEKMPCPAWKGDGVHDELASSSRRELIAGNRRQGRSARVRDRRRAAGGRREFNPGNQGQGGQREFNTADGPVVVGAS